MKKNMDLEALLKQYAPPKVDEDIRKSQTAQLIKDIQTMDYLPRQSFIGQILTQLSFMSCWIWFLQAGILCLFFFYAFHANGSQINALLFCLAPGLSFILTCEMSKSFRADIWEMEAACRYNLAQIFFFRLCILFGGDFLVLTGALIAYRMADGMLWEFCYYALLPFFLTSALSLSIMRRIGNRFHFTLTAAVPLFAGTLNFWAIPIMDKGLSLGGIYLSKGLPIITILALLLLLYNALRLCTGLHYLNESRKDHNAWNFE